MKLRVIQVPGNSQDYVDIHKLVSHGVDLVTGLAAALQVAPFGITVCALETRWNADKLGHSRE